MFFHETVLQKTKKRKNLHNQEKLLNSSRGIPHVLYLEHQGYSSVNLLRLTEVEVVVSLITSVDWSTL